MRLSSAFIILAGVSACGISEPPDPAANIAGAPGDRRAADVVTDEDAPPHPDTPDCALGDHVIVETTEPVTDEVYSGSCPLPPPIVAMSDDRDPPVPPGIDPGSGECTGCHQASVARTGLAHRVGHRADLLSLDDPEYDPRRYVPGTQASGNYRASTWGLGADNCADYYDDQGARMYRNHYIMRLLGPPWFLGASEAHAQVHAKVDCSNDGRGNCVISTCGGTTRVTGGGYSGPGPNEYWAGGQTDKSVKINGSCDLNVGAYSAVSINRTFKASATAKIPVDAAGVPLQADANVEFADNGGVVLGLGLRSDTVVSCKRPGVR